VGQRHGGMAWSFFGGERRMGGAIKKWAPARKNKDSILRLEWKKKGRNAAKKQKKKQKKKKSRQKKKKNQHKKKKKNKPHPHQNPHNPALSGDIAKEKTISAHNNWIRGRMLFRFRRTFLGRRGVERKKT